MKIIKFFLISFSLLAFNCQAQITPKYKNAKLSIEERTADLIFRMTVDEKVGQLLCSMGWEMYEKNGNSVKYSPKFKDLINQKHIGAFWGVFRADPWTQKTLETGLNPELSAKAANELQKYMVENTRLGIPLFFAEESPHGHMAIGTTVFPTGVSLASTWNKNLMVKIGEVMAKEIRLQGGHISYGPVMDLSRDPRWSRVEESFGEDPVLTTEIGAALVKGTGSGNLKNPFSTISTLKHFIAYGIPEGGHNGNTAIIGQREIRENFLPPFKKAVDAGALSIMTAYNSIDGIPCTSNAYLYNDLLKEKWNFRGFVVSDLFSINGLTGSHFVAKDLQESGEMALRAGVDMDLGASGFDKLKVSLAEGKVTLAELDSAVGRVLKLKFEMGLFENPYVNPIKAKEGVRIQEHVDLAKQSAIESIILLKNNGILPLNKNLKRIAVIGPNANTQYNQLGDYTSPQDETVVITPFEGIKAHFKDSEVLYAKGCAIRDTANSNIEESVKLAETSDLTVVVVGGSSARDFKTKYLATGAAESSATVIQDIESGEGFDRANLDLLGKQMELLKAIKATGKPMIVVYIQGRPLNMNWADENADALLCAWYPGMEGGSALAEILSGDVNPSAKLPISVPKSVGQIPVYYNKKNPKGHDYVEMDAKPLFPFGFGMSYTEFEYSNLRIEKLNKDEISISFQLGNIGKYDGTEIVQLYVRDMLASVVQPIKQLKHFERISLKSGESREVKFLLKKDDLKIVNMKMEEVFEPGDFKIIVGASSEDIKLEEVINIP